MTEADNKPHVLDVLPSIQSRSSKSTIREFGFKLALLFGGFVAGSGAVEYRHHQTAALRQKVIAEELESYQFMYEAYLMYHGGDSLEDRAKRRVMLSYLAAHMPYIEGANSHALDGALTDDIADLRTKLQKTRADLHALDVKDVKKK